MKRLPNAKKRTAAKKFKAARKEWRSVKGVAPEKDTDYLIWVRTLGCFVCAMLSMPQKGPTEAAHLGEIRGLRQKAADNTAAPLCGFHHRTDALSHHKIGRRFWDWLGISREVIIARYQRAYAKFKKEQAES